MDLNVSSAASVSYFIAPVASAVLLALEARAPRRIFWPLVTVGSLALVTTGFRSVGVLAVAGGARILPSIGAMLPPLATAINVRSTERYMHDSDVRRGILAVRWAIATACYAIIALGAREILEVASGFTR